MDQEQIDLDALICTPLEEGSDYCVIHVQKLIALIRELRGLRNRAAELEAALKPFAAEGRWLERFSTATGSFPMETRIADLRRARSVLSEAPNPSADT